MLCNTISDMEQNQYSTSEIGRLRPAFNMLTLPACTRDRIKSLEQRFRGHRGRNARKLWTERWRAGKVYNNGVHHFLLLLLRAEVKYDNNIQCKLGLGTENTLLAQMQIILHENDNGSPAFIYGKELSLGGANSVKKTILENFVSKYESRCQVDESEIRSASFNIIPSQRILGWPRAQFMTFPYQPY